MCETLSKTLLPPISNLIENLPLLNLDIPTNPRPPIILLPKKIVFEKTTQYSLNDDYLILKLLFKFYGEKFNGNVPWCFWQMFKDATGHPRSCSSLYHHWKGSMTRKYGQFFIAGKLDQCIQWIEKAIEKKQVSSKKVQNTSGIIAHPSFSVL